MNYLRHLERCPAPREGSIIYGRPKSPSSHPFIHSFSHSRPISPTSIKHLPVPVLRWRVPVLMALTGQSEPEDDAARKIIQGQENLVFRAVATRGAETVVGADGPSHRPRMAVWGLAGILRAGWLPVSPLTSAIPPYSGRVRLLAPNPHEDPLKCGRLRHGEISKPGPWSHG